MPEYTYATVSEFFQAEHPELFPYLDIDKYKSAEFWTSVRDNTISESRLMAMINVSHAYAEKSNDYYEAAWAIWKGREEGKIPPAQQ